MVETIKRFIMLDQSNSDKWNFIYTAIAYDDQKQALILKE